MSVCKEMSEGKEEIKDMFDEIFKDIEELSRIEQQLYEAAIRAATNIS